MKSNRCFALLSFVFLFSALALAQANKIVIAAGTPEDKELQTIQNESDDQKRLVLYKEFVQKFSGNPAAVAYGNWQVSLTYLALGDAKNALSYGDAALAAAPGNLDIAASQVSVAQQLKDSGKIIEYACRGAAGFDQLTPDEQSQSRAQYETLEAAGFNAVVNEQRPKTRLGYIEKYSAAFPKSRFREQVATYAIFTFQELKDSTRLAAYAEQALAANPNSVSILVALASAFSEEEGTARAAKALAYAHKAIELAAKEAANDPQQKIYSGIGHAAVGYVLLKQEKTLEAIPELKKAAELSKDDNAAYSTALYRLGFAYAKLKRYAEARQVLTEVSSIQGPYQAPSRELLGKVNAAAKSK